MERRTDILIGLLSLTFIFIIMDVLHFVTLGYNDGCIIETVTLSLPFITLSYLLYYMKKVENY